MCVTVNSMKYDYAQLNALRTIRSNICPVSYYHASKLIKTDKNSSGDIIGSINVLYYIEGEDVPISIQVNEKHGSCRQYVLPIFRT